MGPKTTRYRAHGFFRSVSVDRLIPSNDSTRCSTGRPVSGATSLFSRRHRFPSAELSQRLTDWVTPIYCLKTRQFIEQKHHNRQKVVSGSNAFACVTTPKTVSRKTNYAQRQIIERKKPYNRTKTKIKLSLFCNISDKKWFIIYRLNKWTVWEFLIFRGKQFHKRK